MNEIEAFSWFYWINWNVSYWNDKFEITENFPVEKNGFVQQWIHQVQSIIVIN